VASELECFIRDVEMKTDRGPRQCSGFKIAD
jgi:hypothetical protein